MTIEGSIHENSGSFVIIIIDLESKFRLEQAIDFQTNEPIATLERAEEIRDMFIAQLSQEPGEYIPPEPPPTPKTDIEILKEENAKLRQDLKSTQAAVDFILLYY